MSSRSTRARGRISYAETRSDDSDASESDGASEEEWNGKKKAKKSDRKARAPQGNKDKAKRGRDSTDDASSSGESDVDDDDGAHDDDEGVNFIHVVPYEIVAEIFSYLSPRELLYFSNLSKSFHAILSGPSSASLWSKARKNLNIPDVEYRSVTERQLATLLFDRKCENCGVGNVELPDLSLCRRLCPPCRAANWVKLSDIAKLYPDFHPAATQAVPTTKYGPSTTSHVSAHMYALYSDLRDAHEALGNLDILDAASLAPSVRGAGEGGNDQGEGGSGGGTSTGSASRSGRRSTRGKINYAVDLDSDQDTAKMLQRANRLKHSWRPYRQQSGQRLEDKLVKSFSPRVQDYLKEQKQSQQEWGKVILSDPVWTSNDLVNLPKVLTDKEWRKIKKRLIKVAGNSLANQMWNLAVAASRKVADKKKRAKVQEDAQRKLAQLEAANEKDHENEDEKEVEDQDMELEDECEESESIAWKKNMLKKPKNLSQKVWKYVLPHLEQLVASGSDLYANEAPREPSKSKSEKKRAGQHTPELDPLSILTYQQRQVKLDFFAKKYRKLVDMQTSIAQRFSLPVFSRFLHLAVVKELYFDIPMFASRSDVASEKAKSDAIWSKKLDEILEQVDDYAVDTVVHAVETILLATTVTTEEEVARLDIVNLLSDGEKQNHRDDHLSLDADFFALPSSWLICGFCRSFLGPLDTVLKHQHESHSSPQAPSTASLADLHPLELSVQAACAVSAVFEVARVSLDDLTATGDLENALQGKMLVWSNLPTKAGKKSTKAEEWQTLVCRIHEMAVQYERSGQTLAAPTLKLRAKTATERRREAWRNFGGYGLW
ncbi:hypothetical protein JCM11491_006850 [Sporobolomyces phaffii]